MNKILNKSSSVSDAGKLPAVIREQLTDEDWELLTKHLFPVENHVYELKTYIRPYYSKLEFAKILKGIYPCFATQQVGSIARNLATGSCYVAGGYNNSKAKFPNLFEKNLIRLYPWVSDSQAPESIMVAFPYENGYNILLKKNWKAKYAPHEPLHRVFLEKLLAGVSPQKLSHAENKSLKIPHWHGEGFWVLDDILRRTYTTGKDYWYLETYTGSERFSDFFINRILTAQKHIRDHPSNHFVFFLRTNKDVQKAEQAITTHNNKSQETEQEITVRNIFFYSYRHLSSFKKKLGISEKTKTN